MANKQGDFIWYELTTNDANAAQEFYGPLLGWDVQDSGMEGMDYRLAGRGGVQIAGIMPLDADMVKGGARPVWAGYIGVDDPDASAKTIAANGGSVVVEPQDIPGVGRFAYAADPQGAPFYVMRGFSDEESTSFAKHEPKHGHCAWNELATSDPEGAKAFYGELFGWTKDGEMSMGEAGSYEFLRYGDYMLGAVMPQMPGMSAPMWTFYFRVPDIDGAAHTIRENGGMIVQEPVEIPGGDYSLVATDPQGTVFGLVGPRQES